MLRMAAFVEVVLSECGDMNEVIGVGKGGPGGPGTPQSTEKNY
jgi:hypothetical protein